MKDPLAVQVLTLDYLAEGFVDEGELDNYCDASEEYPDEGPLTVPIHLTTARFQPTGYLEAPLGQLRTGLVSLMRSWRSSHTMMTQKSML